MARKSQKERNKNNIEEIKEAEQLPLTEDKPRRGFWHQLIPFFLVIAAILIAVCFIFTEECGYFGFWVSTILYGLFSWVAWFIPVLLVYLSIFWRKDAYRRTLKIKLIVTGIIALVLSVGVFYLSVMIDGGTVPSMSIANIWNQAQKENGFRYGGIMGSYIGWVIFKVFSTVGTPIILVSALAVLGLFLFNVQPEAVWNAIQNALLAVIRKIAGAFRALVNKIKGTKTSKKKIYINKPSAVKAVADEIDQDVFDEDDVDDVPKENLNHKKNSQSAQNERNGKAVSSSNGRNQKPQQLRSMNTVAANYGVDEQGDNGEEQGEKAPKLQKKMAPIERDLNLDEIFIEEQKKKKTHQKTVETEETEEMPMTTDNSQVTIENYSDKDNSTATIYGSDDPNDVELDDPDHLTVQRVSLMTSVDAGDEIPVDEVNYTFPPIEFLQSKPKSSNDEDFERECRVTGETLVEALKSFKVNTRLVNISRGPTVTRYELAPDEGVRVKAIANLSDDIALKLAAKGAVRIEAPIVGKSAVGVEIANTVRETVYLRELLENPAFINAKSPITTAVGLDVAGDPNYMDIAKMPHLLIAGTTGAGKSVCINCIVLSLLYKASPDEVKLVMIDPKKVEFSIYNSLPHLKAPVISDAKKAAGALVCSVNEMERRYDLIEMAGVRDIEAYNNATKDDPEKEFLPKLVIVIDELADLMMTAPDSVETSICRIAQKGRAAGIHLVIGTQRPSVDVITGLIKANVPSRIAFTVSSQVDSRTIIDVAGAEKLIGRGDMLYSPIGALKPTRLQGAFVSDAEVERITAFIRDNNPPVVYDESFVSGVEAEAERCTVKSKSKSSSGSSGSSAIDDAAADSGENALSDPKFNEAVNVAIEAGKISTSYLQRRMGLGYGRAAKLIDAMEKLGIVSKPDGQRARNVLISQQEWSEMMMHQSNDED